MGQLAQRLRGRADRLNVELKRAVTEAGTVVFRDARDPANWSSAMGLPGAEALAIAAIRGPKALARGSIKARAALGRPLPPPGPLRMIEGFRGGLVGSITLQVVQRWDAWAAVVGSHMVYARIHELGGGGVRPGYPARPFLAPALARKAEQARALIRAGVARAING